MYIMLSVNSDDFTSFWLYRPFISFLFCLIALASTSNTTLNKSCQSGHLCLVLYLRGKDFSFVLLSMMLVTGLYIWYLLYWSTFPYTHIAERCYQKSMLNFVKWFSYICLDDHDFYPYFCCMLTCGISHWLICRAWTVLASLQWILDHGLWTF